MKQRVLTFLTIAFSLCLLLFACRKEISFFVHDRDYASTELLESAKVWYLQHVNPRAPKIVQYGVLPVYWKEAWKTQTTDGDNILVVPAEEYYISNLDFTYKRFLVFQLSKNRAEKGEIIEFVGNKYNVHDHYDQLIKNYKQEKIPNFNGSILQYDVSYKMLQSQSY